MRILSTNVSEYGTKRMMLVDNPQDDRYQGGVVCYMYRGADDEASQGFEVFFGATIAQVIEHLEETCGAPRSDWIPIPDQIPGCLDEWIGPVRAVETNRVNQFVASGKGLKKGSGFVSPEQIHFELAGYENGIVPRSLEEEANAHDVS